MQALFTLIRFPNLVIVALTQCLLYYRLLAPALREAGIGRNFSDREFGIFVAVTVLITASGYIINDLLDHPTDIINKPQKVVIDREIEASVAYWLYFSLNLLGYILALYLAFIVQYLPYLFLFPAAITGLYLYSHFLKRKPLWGNLLVAFYCAAVAGVLLLAEQQSLRILFEADRQAAQRVEFLFLWYIGFAFLATLYRELIKDLQDEPGDRLNLMYTAPVVWGQRAAKTIALFTGMLLLVFIGLWSAIFHNQLSATACSLLGIGVAIPLLYTLVLIRKAETSRQFHHLSQVVKWLMVGGILLLFFF